MPFAFPLISVGGGWGGERVRFESEEFNDRFKIKTNSPKFTYDVIHPRTMEFMMAVEPPDFRIEDQLMRFSLGSHDIADRVLRRFRARVLRPGALVRLEEPRSSAYSAAVRHDRLGARLDRSASRP